MAGIIFSIIAGASMSIQGVMNTRLSDKIGIYESNAFVQGTAFLLSLIAVWIMGKGSFKGIADVNKFYLFGRCTRDNYNRNGYARYRQIKSYGGNFNYIDFTAFRCGVD